MSTHGKGKANEDGKPLNIGKQRIELSDKYLRAKAMEVLERVKKTEAKHLAGGARWVNGPNRSKILKRGKTPGKTGIY